MKKKLYRIDNSKEPTLNQLQRMTFNLCTVRNTYATIQVRVWTHEDGKERIDYWVGMGSDIPSKEFKSWGEVLNRYSELMKETSNV